jgi:hypothetical protein
MKVDKKKNTELIQKEKMEGTPFEIVTIEKESFGTLGQYRVTEKMKTKAAVKKYLKTPNWDTIATIVSILITENKKEQ